VEIFGHENHVEPEPVNVNLEGMIEHFKVGFRQFSTFYKEIFCEDCFEQVRKTAHLRPQRFHLPTDTWIQILYELAATFHTWSVNRNKLIDLMTPLYYARVASFVRQTWEMSSEEAERLVEEQAQSFEGHKDYLITVWDEKYRAMAASGVN